MTNKDITTELQNYRKKISIQSDELVCKDIFTIPEKIQLLAIYQQLEILVLKKIDNYSRTTQPAQS